MNRCNWLAADPRSQDVGLDTDDFGGLRFVVDGRGEYLPDVVLIEFAQARQKIATGSPSVRGNLG